MIPLALVALSAVLTWAAFPPIAFAPLAFVAPVPLFHSFGRGLSRAWGQERWELAQEESEDDERPER